VLQLYTAGVLRQFLDWYFPPAQRCCADAHACCMMQKPQASFSSRNFIFKQDPVAVHSETHVHRQHALQTCSVVLIPHPNPRSYCPLGQQTTAGG
jgi:hypothetical protein